VSAAPKPPPQEPSRQRYLAPVFFVMAVLTVGLAIAQAIKGLSWLVVVSDLVIAGVMVAIGLRVMKPPQQPGGQRPLRAPRPPR